MKASQIKTLSRQYKALGHSKRLEIVTLLQGHSLTVNQIVQMTALRQAAVSQHLMILKDINLVNMSKLGKEVYYSLCLDPFKELTNFSKSLTHLTPLSDAEPTVVDPVCDMSLTPSTASFTCEYDGVRHYFCGKGCLKEFNSMHKGAI